MIAFCVQYAKDDYSITFDPIKEFVRKPMREQTPKTVIIDRTAFGLLSKKMNRAADLIQKFVTQTESLRVIPKLRFAQIRFGIWTNNDAPTHGRDLRSRASTSAHGDPSSGFAP